MKDDFKLPFGTPASKYSLTDDERKALFNITNDYHTGKMSEVLTSCSTNTASMVVTYIKIPDKEKLIQNDNDFVQAVISKEYSNFKRFGSPYQGYLERAKRELESNILHKDYPNIEDKEAVILFMGGALNKQIDKKYKRGDIIKKIENLLNDSVHSTKYSYFSSLKDKYIDLNPFYNASKHEGNAANTKYENILNTYDGRLITIHFYETARRIFEWYYDIHSQSGIPSWEYLKPPKYYGLYDFITYTLPVL